MLYISREKDELVSSTYRSLQGQCWQMCGGLTSREVITVDVGFHLQMKYITGWWFGTFGLCFHILAIILAILIPTDFHIFQRGRYTTNQIRHILTSELVAFVCSFCVCFPECVAKGSCFLSWASRPWWTVCSSFLIFSLMFTPRCLQGKWEKVMCCDVWKRISRGRRGTLWHSSKSCFVTL